MQTIELEVKVEQVNGVRRVEIKAHSDARHTSEQDELQLVGFIMQWVSMLPGEINKDLAGKTVQARLEEMMAG